MDVGSSHYILLGHCFNVYYYIPFQFYFRQKGFLEGYIGCYGQRICYSCTSKGLYHVVCRHYEHKRRLGQQQVYESSLRSLIHFLFSQILGGGWGKGGTLQGFLWYTHAPFAINTALLGNLLVCFIYLQFQLHRHVLIKLFLDSILQHQLEFSKISSTLAFLCFETISHKFLWGFTLKRSIRRRSSKIFMFCIANLIFGFGNCSTGCLKGGT